MPKFPVVIVLRGRWSLNAKQGVEHKLLANIISYFSTNTWLDLMEKTSFWPLLARLYNSGKKLE